ncbi:MAG TPA: tetratricopeptide repeat protein [Candidatus Babeliales bacterium]|nr:tetratricopeptide repeat protein [Candidatus Babeliales bacterium]
MPSSICSALLIISLVGLSGCGQRRSPKSSLAYNYYHQALVAAEKNPREALDLIEKSLLEQTLPRALVFKATLLFQVEKYLESVTLFEKIISDKRIPPTLKTDAKNNYACVLVALGKLAAAEELWRSLTADRHYLSPEVAWLNIGLLKLNQQDYRAAAQAFNQALRIANDYVDAYYYLALVLTRLHEWQTARQTLHNLLNIVPDHAAAQKLLSEINVANARGSALS